MKLSQWKASAGLDEQMRVRNKLRVLVAAIGALAAVVVIGVAVVTPTTAASLGSSSDN